MQKYIFEKIMGAPNQLISFAEFMEMVLYHPVKGYYMREREKIGKEGDFITTSNVSNIFGTIFSKWFLKQVEQNGIFPAVCEVGGGNGRFAKSFLETWNNQSTIPLTYYMIETSPYHRKLQKELLSSEKSVIYIDQITDLKPFSGLLFSNELFDALPIHVIENNDGKLYEVMIGWGGEKFIEHNVPLSNPKILKFLEEQRLTLNENHRIEIPIIMEKVLKDFSDTLESGLVATIDYGYTNDEWMEPARRQGSLRGYYKHQMITDVLQFPGEIDITSHIHFDSLIEIGEKFGLNFVLKDRQDEFLIRAGILKELEDHYDPNPFSEKSKRNRAIRSLIMPGISSHFHVILQEKGTGLTALELF